MIPLSEVRILNTPVNVLDFPATSTITELAWMPGNLHLRHSQETNPAWTVLFETTTQHATLWVIAVDPTSGEWVAAGVERIRPGQIDKPEGDNPTDFLLHWVEGRPFGPFNNRAFAPGETIGVFLVAGNSRLAGDFHARERTHVVEVAIPPAAGARWPPFVWVEGQDLTPPPPTPHPIDQPSQKDAPPAAPADPNPPFPDLVTILEQRHYAVMGECLAIRNQIAALQKTIATAGGAFSDQGRRFEAGLKAVKTIAAQLLAGAAATSTRPAKTGSTPPAARKKAGNK
jgi:hypothetical protein